MEEEKVSIVKCDSYEPKKIRKALEKSLENINFDFKKNLKILIKPNILMPVKPLQHITTNPIIMQELCKILEKYSAKITVAESSAYKTDKAFKTSGIEKACKKYAKKFKMIK